MATYLDVLNRESVKSVSLRRAKQLEQEAAQGTPVPGAGGFTAGEGAPG